MKILRFNESKLTQYTIAVLIDEYSFMISGVFNNDNDRDNWILNIINKQTIKLNDQNTQYDDSMILNPDDQYIHIDVDDATSSFEDVSGSYVFTEYFEDAPNKNFNYMFLISDEWNHITCKVFENKNDMEFELIAYMNDYNWDNIKFKSALRAKNWYNSETDGDLYYGKTKFYENVKLEYGVDLFRSKEEFNL